MPTYADGYHDGRKFALTEASKKMTREEWLAYGIEQGFCSMPICVYHDGIPTTHSEDLDIDKHGEICLHLIRPYKNGRQRKAVEDNTPAAKGPNK
jgi:hypothetical protein